MGKVKKGEVKQKKKADGAALPVVGGYMVVPVKSPFAGDDGAHHLYLRRHQTKNTAESDGVRPYITLVALCSRAHHRLPSL